MQIHTRIHSDSRPPASPGRTGEGVESCAALRRRTGPDLSSHDGLYELHGTDLTSDAHQFDKSMSRGDHPGTAGSGQRVALQNPASADPYSRTVDYSCKTPSRIEIRFFSPKINLPNKLFPKKNRQTRFR